MGIWLFVSCNLQSSFVRLYKSHVAAIEYALLLSCLALYPVALSLLALLLWVRLHILGRNGKMGVLVLALILQGIVFDFPLQDDVFKYQQIH